MKFYKSTRVAKYHPEWRPRDVPPPPPTYQVVSGYPTSCACINGLALVGEAPGFDEDQTGVPFVGRSGEEVDRFLDAYGIMPDECFITNIGRVFRHGNPDPTPQDIEMWESLLHAELNVAKPTWIAAVGRISTRYFLGDVDMGAVHGVPYVVQLPWLHNDRGGLVVVVPVYHPAAGFHSTELQANIAYDFAQLAATINGQLTPRNPEFADRFPDPDYRDLGDGESDLALIHDSLAGGHKAEPLDVAIDTEGLPGKAWGLSYSVKDGQAFVIRKVNRMAIRVFYIWLMEGIKEGRIHVLLHNSLHDLRVLRELGIPIPPGCFTDTMVLAYHLCIEPQGLKPLAYRHAGMDMESYDEQVQDARDQIALEYYHIMKAVCDSEIHHQVFSPDPELTPTGKIKRKGGEPVYPVVAEWFEGGFGQIEPYGYSAYDKNTGQLIEKVKTPKQIKFRVDRAMTEFEEGNLTAAGLRKRWSDTDEMVTEPVEALIGEMREADLDDVPLARAVRYAARDADATRRVAPVLRERHRAMGLTQLGKIDHAIIPMVDEMQANGIVINKPYLIALSADLARRMRAVQAEIKEKFGFWINPNSGDQVADLLFKSPEEGGYGLIPTKKTKGTIDKETGELKKRRGSTQDKVLEGMRRDHPIIPLILDYRGLSKAKTSFADIAIKRAVLEDGQWVIHCLFRITRVSSGRLSATGPNLLAVVGGKLGLEIRDGYIAGDGFEFFEIDLSQIEMRVMASEANDAFLISMIVADEDIHAGTASKMFHLGLPRPYRKEQVKKEQRDPAKRTGFGVITGIQPPGLVDQMRLQGMIVSEDEAANWIRDWLAACPAVPEYMRACHREARAYGYVRDWAGRIRYLPGIHSPFKHVREEAGRQSHSHKIQGGAQEIMKIAMATVHREILPYWRERGKFIAAILQVHDSLMFRTRGFSKEDKEELEAQVKGAMFAAAPPGFRVPLDASGGWAATWGQLEH